MTSNFFEFPSFHLHCRFNYRRLPRISLLHFLCRLVDPGFPFDASSSSTPWSRNSCSTSLSSCFRCATIATFCADWRIASLRCWSGRAATSSLMSSAVCRSDRWVGGKRTWWCTQGKLIISYELILKIEIITYQLILIILMLILFVCLHVIQLVR